MKLELSELIIFVFIYLHILCSKENEPLVAEYSEIMKSLGECRYL